MKFKKLISLFCALAMLLSAASLTAVAEEINLQAATGTKHMIINDQFDNRNLNGWVQVINEEKPNHCTLTTEAIGDGNYALTYESFKTSIQNDQSDWQFEYIERDFDDIVFTEGVDTVIKTRIKTTGTNSTFLKMNMHIPNYDRFYAEEWNLDLGTLLRTNGAKYGVINGVGRTANNVGNPNLHYMDIEYATQNVDMANKWINAEIKIHGNTKTASFVLENDEGTLIDTFTSKSIDFEDEANWEEDVLETLAFRHRSVEKLYVDYFQVWQEGVKVTNAEGEMNLTDVKVKFTGNTAKLLDLSDFAELYENDGVTPVSAIKSYDKTTNTVNFKSTSFYEPGTVYKVKIDTENLSNELDYTYEALTEISIPAPPCAAQSLSIEGKIIPNKPLKAKYIVMPQDAVEGDSIITWIAVDDQGNETVIQSGTSKEYIAEEEYAQHKIKYTVLPKAIVGGVEKTGILAESDVVTPLSKPVASNLKFNRTGAMINVSIGALYDYFDADGDVESGSEIKWHAGSAPDSNDYEAFAEGSTIRVSEEMIGKYLKFTVTPKNEAEYLFEGDVLWSEPIGPVADIITASNLFVNGDLEAGTVDPWYIPTGNTDSYQGIELATEGCESNYSLLMHKRLHNVKDKFAQDIVFSADETYLLSSMVKSADGKKYNLYQGYVWSNSTQPYIESERTEINNSWQHSMQTIVITKSGTSAVSFLTFESVADDNGNMIYPAEAYVDNMYIGELMITDIDTVSIDPITIPQTGEKAAAAANGNGKAYNQFGNTVGLTTQKISVLDPEVPGIKIEGLNVVVTPQAVAGTYNIPVACVPNEEIPGVETFIEYVPLTLLAHGDISPKALNVSVSGTVASGGTLTGSYDFYQVNGKDNASTFRWLYSDKEDGVYLPIEGATSETFVVTSDYADKFVKFEVTPKTTDGMVGEAVVSDYVTFPTSPVATDVTIKGSFNVGGTVTADYVYYDANGDEADAALYQWYIISEDGSTTAVSGANTKDFVLTEDTVDKRIKVEVTPVSKVAPVLGTKAGSEAYYGPTVPVASNVNVYNKNGILTGEYTYYHAHNASEKGTTYSWTIGGRVISTNLTCSINFEGTQLVTFTVTPVGDTNPSTGNPVSVSLYVTGLSGSGSAGGGGGTGGGGGGSAGGAGGSVSAGASSGGVPNINEMQTPQTEVKEPENTQPKSDIDGHWGAEYIKEMEERGVMKADEKGNFDPDRTVSRQEMITYLFDALKLEEAEYSAEFSDVSALDGYAGKLQTMINNGTIASYHEFRPNDGISREEMCKILYVSLENAGKLVKAETNVLDTFADKASISDWAVDYVNTIYANKIMIGTSDTTFAPKENITRAQVATLLVRILDVMEKEAE